MTLHLDPLRASIVSDIEELTADGSIPKSEVAELLRSLADELENRAPADREALVEVVERFLRSWLLDEILPNYDIDSELASTDPEFSEAMAAQARAVVDALAPRILAPGMVAVRQAELDSLWEHSDALDRLYKKINDAYRERFGDEDPVDTGGPGR